MRTRTGTGWRRFRSPGPAMAMLLVLNGCGLGSEHAPSGAASFPWPLAVPLGLDAFAPFPEQNPPTLEKVELGRLLFFDPVLSANRTRSCASCHRPEAAFADTLPISPGVRGRRTARNASTLVNRAYGRSFFWDGRAATLEDAVLMPIVNPDELASSLPELVGRLNSSGKYRRRFRGAFDGAEISEITISAALASYIRSVRVGGAPVDRYSAGDGAALTDAARRGRSLFLGKAGCATCHSGPTFTDERFHNTGVSANSGDPGRYAVTGDESDRGRFKTPTLREVSRTAPYMHDGSIATLEEVVEFYDRGGVQDPDRDLDIHALRLAPMEKEDLVAFLRALGADSER